MESLQRWQVGQSVFDSFMQLPAALQRPKFTVSPVHVPQVAPLPQRAPVPLHDQVLSQSPVPHAVLKAPPPIAQEPPQQN